jgi:hypothetical protein
MNTLLTIVELFLTLPWWGSALLAASIIAFFVGAGVWLNWKLNAITHEALAEVASPLVDAQANIHSIEPAERPTALSAFDVEDDDEDDDFEFDAADDELEAWQTGGDFYWIDATIAPQDPAAAWHASLLTLVPAGWKGAIGEFSESLGPLHSVELFAAGGFRPLRDGEDVLTGRQRLRLLMAAPAGFSHVKFAYYSATFGDLKLPSPLAVAAR